MKYMVGMPQADFDFINYIIDNKENIYEVYFSWGDFPSGRSAQTQSDNYAPWILGDIQRRALQNLSDNDIALNLLFNANCYGKDSQSRSFFDTVGTTVDYIQNAYGLNSVTTTSPLIAKFIKNNFDNLEVRASVNMEIGTVQGMKYLSDYFDSYYIKRELNRDFDKIKALSIWAKDNGKKLYALANSGCLNFCSAHNFHDNLVAHEAEISKMDNAYDFKGICKEYLSDPENYKDLPNVTNFIRPEDIEKYEEFFDAVKLATRVHKTPKAVLNSYINQKYSGDILRLLEPAHSIYPYVLENGDPLKIVKIAEDIYTDNNK